MTDEPEQTPEPESEPSEPWARGDKREQLEDDRTSDDDAS